MTITVTAAHTSSTAPPGAFFERWADVATWPEWNTDTEWVRLDGPFGQGTTGTLKPKGGPKVRFTVERLVPGQEFLDVSRLAGARLVFDHRVRAHDGGCEVDVEIRMSGPLARLWLLVLGKGLRASVQQDLDSLARAAERAA